MRRMVFRLENRIGVATPASTIWEVISDLDGWSRWNPLYPQASGKLGFGETLTLTLKLPEQEPETIRPTVLEWSPNSLIHWSLKLAGGMVKTTRYLEIEALTETGCIFSNGEVFDGVLSRFVPRRLRRRIRQGFDGMGEAAEREAEARWAARRAA